MFDSYATPARDFAPGIGEAVAARTITRKIEVLSGDIDLVPFEVPRRDDVALDDEIAALAKSKGLVISGYHVEYGDDLIVRGTMSVVGEKKSETWADVAHRVAVGNAMLDPGVARNKEEEFHKLHHHLRQASVLMSGRHLQHGDETQSTRNMEVFTNCSTAAMNFLNFYLLLNGSGVGRDYSDSMMIANYANMPIVVPVIDMHHKDCQSGEIIALDEKSARHLYAGRTIRYFRVPDSREGWAKTLEKIEYLAFKKQRNHVLIIDFSDVRHRGSPIMGMQGRPASGPGALMAAIRNIASLRDAGMDAWRSTMYADHYIAECVLVGGARRAARMATKYWKDKTIFGFIEVKRGGFLWSSNNSVLVDAEFWAGVEKATKVIKEARATCLGSPSLLLLEKKGLVTELEAHAKRVFDAIAEAAYFDQTGEPGLINVDKLTWNEEGIETLFDGNFAESEKFKLDPETHELAQALAKAFANDAYRVITNPCGEIVLGKLGGYCVIADVVPFHANRGFFPATDCTVWDDDAEDAFRTATRALIRTNLMDSLYGKEVKRTNRIGVGITGFHEYAWERFGYGFRDLIDEAKSKDFWMLLSRFKRAIQDEAKTYANALGVAVPHTNTTIKPAGCASLDSAIKTTEGVLTMRELFAKHGVTEAVLLTMQDGTWIKPTVKTMVLDEGNIEREVTKLYLNGVKPVYEIEFEDGTVVKLTGNHKLKTVSGEWKRVDELTEADDILQY